MALFRLAPDGVPYNVVNNLPELTVVRAARFLVTHNGGHPKFIDVYRQVDGADNAWRRVAVATPGNVRYFPRESVLCGRGIVA